MTAFQRAKGEHMKRTFAAHVFFVLAAILAAVLIPVCAKAQGTPDDYQRAAGLQAKILAEVTEFSGGRWQDDATLLVLAAGA